MAEEENVDEAVTAEAKSSNNIKISIKEERKTQEYKETVNIYVEIINTFPKEKQSIYNSMKDNIRSCRTRALCFI